MTDLHKDLQSLEAQWRKAESAEPPDLVDQAVRNAARRQLPSKPSRRLPWIGAVATAFVVVLAATLVIQQDPGQPPAKQDRSVEVEPEASMASEVQAMEPQNQAGAEMRAMRKSVPETDRVREQAADVAATAPELKEEALNDEAFSSADQQLEAEIRQMLEWLQSGEHDQLRAALQEFRLNHPDYPLPQELADF